MTTAAPPTPPPERILLIKPSALGDVVSALPVLRGCRRSYPDARIEWLVSEDLAGLLEDEPQLDALVRFPRRRLGRAWRDPAAAAELLRFLLRLRRGRYDWVLDLQGLLRSGAFARATRARMRAGFADARELAPLAYTHSLRPQCPHTVDRNIALARSLGIDARPEDLRLHIRPEAREQARRLIEAHGLREGGFWALVPPTRWPSKCYPLRHWRRVAGVLAGRMPVAVIGTQADRSECDEVARAAQAAKAGAGANLAGLTPLSVLPAVIAASAGVICCDSAVKFLAAATGRPCTVLIGPTRAERTGPYGPYGRVASAEIPCRGCLDRTCPHITCMQLIRPEDVIDAAVSMLREGPPPCRTASSFDA